jgi:ferritin
MLSDNLHKALNDQMNFEFYSSHVYLAMAAYCSSESFDGFANFFIVQAEEERFHAMKIYRYINTVGKRATIAGMEELHNDYQSVLDCYQRGLEHEKVVTSRFYKLMDIAMEEREHATINFLKWFIDEQVEEESNFDNIIQKLKRIEKDSNAFYMLEAEMATRTFVAPAE